MNSFPGRFWFLLVFSCLVAINPLRAEQFGLFTYEVSFGTIQITGYPKEATGDVVVPETIAGVPVTYIGYRAFAGCSGVNRITIPSGVTYIQVEAFSGCSGLTSIQLPAGLTNLEEAAFRGCSRLAGITLPSGISVIRPYTFENCSALTAVVIHPGINTIAVNGFDGCAGLISIEVDSFNPVFSSREGVLFNKGQTELLRCPPGKAGHWSIPSGVTSIGHSAFFSCGALTRLTFPESASSIGFWAFRGCSALNDFEVHPLNPDLSAGEGVLFNKDQSTLLAFPAARTGTYRIPASVTTIASFSAGPGLTKVIFHDDVTTISSDAFARCGGLTSVTIPPKVTVIDYGAFADCPALVRVTLPPGLTKIDYHAFEGCTALTSIVIPSGVTNFGLFCFDRCPSLRRMVFLGNAPPIFNAAPAAPALGFSFYYLTHKTGFTSPVWNGYPAMAIDTTTHPAAPWLLKHDLAHDADLQQDPDGDGVILLMAYALNLDPGLNLRSSLPAPVLDETTLSLSYHGAAPGISYQPETSTDLMQWTTQGVTQSAPNAAQRRTATVPRSGSQQFIRLKVIH